MFNVNSDIITIECEKDCVYLSDGEGGQVVLSGGVTKKCSRCGKNYQEVPSFVQSCIENGGEQPELFWCDECDNDSLFRGIL